MVRLLIILLLLTVPARADSLPVPCEDIKRHVAEHGRVSAIAWALKNGFTWKQINQARKECGIK